MFSFTKTSGGDVISPVALGLISDPPTIVLTYDVIMTSGFLKGGRRKRRKRKMPLRDFTDKSNVKRYAFNLRQRHNRYLENVIEVTLEKMLRIIQEIQKGNSVARAVEIVDKEYYIDPQEDLNVLSPAQLAQRKAVMDETFHKNLIKPEDPEFVYDKVVTFDSANKEDNEWDDDCGSGEHKDNSGNNLKQQEEVEEKTNGCENEDKLGTNQNEKTPEMQIDLPQESVNTNDMNATMDKDYLENSFQTTNILREETPNNEKIKVLDEELSCEPLKPIVETESKETENNINLSISPPPTNVVDDVKNNETEGQEDLETGPLANIGETLGTLETGILDEDDELFWQ